MSVILQSTREFWILYAEEIRRYLAESLVYISDYLSSLITTGIVVALFVFSSGSSSDPAYWVGFLYWNASALLITESCVSISSDKQNGTFTQLMLCPTSMLRQITVKTLTWSVVNIAINLVFIVTLFMVLGSPIGFNWQLLPIGLVTFTGLFGLTMLMAALTILYTKTASFCDLLGYVMMFLSGVVIPTEALPTPLATIGHMMPITQGIIMSRTAILNEPMHPHDWLWLSIQALAFVAAGYVLFKLIVDHGRKHGINMRY